MGDYFGIGFANALLDHQNDSYGAGERIAYSARNGLAEAVSRVHDYIDGGVDTDLTIRPVLDLSELKGGVDTMNGLFNTHPSLDMAYQTGLSFRASERSLREMKVDNAEVVSEITRLRGEVAELSGVIQRMRVVMDTGALVGAIATPMNQALGRQAVYDRRRN